MSTTTQNSAKDVPAVPLQIELRDWFAGQALAIVAETYPDWQLKAWFGNRSGLTREEIRATAAYSLADAMLRARALATHGEG